MNRKEINEIRRFLISENRLIKDIYTCYVNAEKEKIFFDKLSLIDLEEDEEMEFLKLFRRVLSTDIGRKFQNLDFPNGENQTRDELYKIVNEDQRDDLVEEVFDKIIDAYPNKASFGIFLLKGVYDVPGMASDGFELEDSDLTYSFVIGAVCPIKLSKGKLSYVDSSESFAPSKTMPVVAAPDTGFIYPSFTGRQTNVRSLGYYTRTANDPLEDFQEEFLGCQMLEDAESQKETYAGLLLDTFDNKVGIKTVVELNESLQRHIEASEEEGTRGPLKGFELEDYLKDAGAQSLDLDKDIQLMAENLVEKNYHFQAEGIDIKISPEKISLAKIQEVNGIRQLTIPLGQMNLNGVPIKES